MFSPCVVFAARREPTLRVKCILSGEAWDFRFTPVIAVNIAKLPSVLQKILNGPPNTASRDDWADGTVDRIEEYTTEGEAGCRIRNESVVWLCA
jgi:hypothetical protein